MLPVQTNVPPVKVVTVKVVEPLIVSTAASIVVCPALTALASPVALMVATPDADELHVAVLVRFCVLPSLYVPVAVNCCVLPTAMEGFAGVTAIDTSTAAVTVSVVEPVILLIVAPIVEAPLLTPFAKPPAVIVATAGAEELHVAVLVRFCVLPSLYVPVAVNCCVVPAAMEGFAGVTAID